MGCNSSVEENPTPSRHSSAVAPVTQPTTVTTTTTTIASSTVPTHTIQVAPQTPQRPTNNNTNNNNNVNSPSTIQTAIFVPITEKQGINANTGWDDKFPVMTRDQLMCKREEFWDTRVEGRAEIWQAIRMCSESNDDATCIAIYDSVGLSQLKFNESDNTIIYTYDTRGFRYDIPIYCLFEPKNLAVGLILDDDLNSHKSTNTNPSNTTNNTTTTHKSSSSHHPIHNPEHDKLIKFILRLSNGLPDISLQLRLGTTINDIKQLLCTEYTQQHKYNYSTKQIKCIYQGKIIKDHYTLLQAKIKSGFILQLFIYELLQPL